MKKLKNNITREQVNKIVNKLDADQSGKISIEEFTKLMS